MKKIISLWPSFSSLLLALLFAEVAVGSDFTKLYNEGEGALYSMKSKAGPDAQVSIYYTDVEKAQLKVEYFIEGINTFLPYKVWQQFTLAHQGQGTIEVTQGYILKEGMEAPETLEKKHLKGQEGGVFLSDFLFKDPADLNQYLVNTEKVQVPAGNVEGRHYRVERNGQTVDFWISVKQQATLLKLVSTGSKYQNYQLELLSLLKNVKATIDPSEAKPLSEGTRALLEQTLR